MQNTMTDTMKQDARVLGLLGWVAVAALVVGGGCAGRPALIPVTDPDLKKTAVQFAADAARRQYPGDAPRGGDAQAQAVVDHGMFNRLEVINLSDQDWTDVEIWVNQAYVVHVSSWPAKKLKKINFTMLYDQNGQSIPIDNKAVRVQRVELSRGGKVYSVPAKLAD